MNNSVMNPTSIYPEMPAITKNNHNNKHSWFVTKISSVSNLTKHVRKQQIDGNEKGTTLYTYKENN